MASLALENLMVEPLVRGALVALAAVGTSWLLGQTLHFLYEVYKMFLRPGKNLRKEYGSWAIVTGCTDGIGKALATELARKKLNLILVSRTLSKLEELGAELSSKFGIQTKSVALDLSLSPSTPETAKGYAQIESLCNELEVGVLVNNAGVSYPYAKYVHELDEEYVTMLLTLNVVAVTKIVRIVIPKMAERKRGAIVNMGSGAATVIPCDPLYAIYAASKAYVDQFSKTLDVEFSKLGVDVQCQAPLLVTTKMSKVRHSTLMVPTPSLYAKYAVNWIGYEPRCTPYWFHGFLWALISRVPVSYIDNMLLRRNVDIRRRGMAKEARTKKGQ